MITWAERLFRRGSILQIIVAALVIAALVAFAIFARANVISGTCSDLRMITANINYRNAALREFIVANVEARQHTADLAHEEGHLAEAHLQRLIAVQYAEIGKRFTDLPTPAC